MVDSLCKRFVVPQSGRKFFILAIIIILGTIVNHIILAVFIKIIFSYNNFSWDNLGLLNWDIVLKPVYNLTIFMMLYLPLRKIDKFFTQQNKIIAKNNV
jgi:hypothetical protein